MHKKAKKAKTKKETAPAVSADASTREIVPIEIPCQETDLMLADITPIWNARTEFKQEDINDLRDSIAEIGVQTRLWVYPLDEPVNGANYGLIAGECRWRAAMAAGLLQVPVKIFACDERQALALGLIDNIKRRNLSEMDEAFAYRKLIDQNGFKAWDPEHPESSIGPRLVSSKTKIYAMLKLTELPKLGIDAIRAGELTPSVGVRIARIPSEVAQKDALAEAIRRGWTDAYAAQEIERKYSTELKGAPFNRKDETLNPARGSCEKCPMRTGNMAELFPDLASGRADICTDPACFREKCERAFVRRSVEYSEKGGRVLSEKEARKVGLGDDYSSVSGNWVKMDERCYWLRGEAAAMTAREIFKAAEGDGRGVIRECMPALALANDGTGRHFELIERDTIKMLAKRAKLLDKGGEETDQKAREKQAKEDKKRDRLIAMYQLRLLGVSANDALADEAGGFPVVWRALGEYLSDMVGKEALKLVLNLWEIDGKEFKLEDDRSDEWICRAVVAAINRSEGGALAGAVCQLMCAPEYLSSHGKLPAKAAPVLRMIGLEQNALHEMAIDGVPGGERIRQHQRDITALAHRIVEALSKDKKKAGMDREDLAEKFKCSHLDLGEALEDPRFDQDGYMTVRLAIWNEKEEAAAI